MELRVSRLQDRGQKLAGTPNYMMVRFRALTFHGSGLPRIDLIKRSEDALHI